jgi:hypothetical protein
MSRQLINELTVVDAGSSPHSVSVIEERLLGNAVAGPVIFNLPLAADAKFRFYVVKKIDASTNAVTIQPQVGETIDGAGSRVLEAQNEVVAFFSDGTTWYATSFAGGGQSPNGTLYVSAPLATTVDTAAERIIAGTTTGKNLTLFTHTNGRLTYNGVNPIRVLVVAQASFLTNTVGLKAQVRVALNGTGIADSEAQQDNPGGTDLETVPVVTTVDLVQNDYLEMFVLSPDFGVGVTVTAENLVMSVIGIQDLSSQVGLQRTYGESLGVSTITGTTAWQNKLSVVMPGTSPAGTYRVQWSAEIKNDGTNAEAGLRVLDGGGTVYNESQERMAGTPANQWQAKSGFFDVAIVAGGDTFSVEFMTSSSPRTTSIRRARIEILRVP